MSFLIKLYIRLRVRLRIIRLYFLRMPKPDDARTPQEIFEAIKKNNGSYFT